MRRLLTPTSETRRFRTLILDQSVEDPKLVRRPIELPLVPYGADRTEQRPASGRQPSVGNGRIKRVQHPLEVPNMAPHAPVDPRNVLATPHHQLTPFIGSPFLERVWKAEPKRLGAGVERAVHW